MTCAVPGCTRPGRLLPRGWRCDGHRPVQPSGGYCAPGACLCPAVGAEREHLLACALAGRRHVPAPVVASLGRRRCPPGGRVVAGRRAGRYGTSTTDPLGRDGPGWRVSEQSRLPVRVKETA